MNLENKSATLCYRCKANWLYIIRRDNKYYKECRRPWWKFWQWHCGALFLLDKNGNYIQQ